jgi:hypothetical protein
VSLTVEQWKNLSRYFAKCPNSFRGLWSSCFPVRWLFLESTVNMDRPIWGPHSGGHRVLFLIGYNLMQYIGSETTYRRQMWPLPTISNNKPNNKPM